MSDMTHVGQFKAMAASGAVVAPGGTMLRFICSTAGTLQLTETNGGATILAVTAVAAGQVITLGLRCPNGCTATLAGGATGTFVCA
jgi:hypothetical protein